MADPHSCGHYQGTAAVSQKRTVVDAAAGGSSAGRPATAAKRPCCTCACSGQACYCGATTAAAAVAAAAATAAALSRDQHGAALSGRPDSRWYGVAQPAASSPSAHRSLVTVAPVVTISRATGTSGQFAVSSVNTMIASPRHAGNLSLQHHQLQAHSTQHQHRHQSSSSGTVTYLRASPRAAIVAPPASMSASASEIMNDLMRSAVATSAVAMSARPSPSIPASSAGPVSARPRAAGSSSAEVQVSQTTSLPVTVVWPPTANGSAPSTPGTVVHYVPGSLGDIRQQAAASATNRLVAERRLFRCTACEYFTTQQHKLAVHAELYHSGKGRAGPVAIRMAASVGQSSAAAAAASTVSSGMSSRQLLSSPPAAVSATDAAVRSMSVAMATGRSSHTPERRADATFRGGLAQHGSGEPSPLRATMMTSASGSPGAGQPSGGMQVWWPPTPGSKPSNGPAGAHHVEAARPTAGTLSCPFCSFKATLTNLLQLHIANRHGGQLQGPPNNYQRSSSHPASHTTRIADVLPTAAPVPPQAAAAPGRTTDNERGKTNSADHDDPDVIITSWTIGPAVTAVQSSRLPLAPAIAVPAPSTVAAGSALPAEPAVAVRTSSSVPPAATSGVERQFASAPPDTLPSHASEAANSVTDLLPLGCRSKPLSPPPPLQQWLAGAASAGVELVQQASTGGRRQLSELLAPSPPLMPLLLPPPLIRLQSPASVASAEVELAQLLSSDRRPLSEPLPKLPPSPGIPITSPASCGAIDSRSPSSPAATHTSTTSAGVAAEQLPAAGVAETSSSWADDSPAAASLPTRSTFAEPSPPPSAAADLAALPCAAAPVAADASLYALTEPAATVDESHASGTASLPAAFTWEDLVCVGMDCAPLDVDSGSSALPTASADAAAATETVLKAERQPSPSESSSQPSYFWSEQLLLGGLLFEDCDESAATGGRLPGADYEPHEQSEESASAAAAAAADAGGARRSQLESVDRLQDGLYEKQQVTAAVGGIVGGGDGGATSAQSAAARSSVITWSDAGDDCVSREAPAAGDCPPAACGGVALVLASPRDTPPSSTSCADAFVGDSGVPSLPAPPAARREAAEPVAAGKHRCGMLPVLPQDKPACAAELGEPIAIGNGEYSSASAASSSLADSPFVSGATSDEQSKITSVEQQAAYLPNGRSMSCVEEKAKPDIANVFTAKYDAATDCSSNLRDPDDRGRALMSVKTGMLPVVSADGVQCMLKQEHETEVDVSPAISRHSHDMTPADDSSSRIRNVDTAEEKSPSNAADGCYRSGIEPLTHSDTSLPTGVVGNSRDGGKETTSFSSPGPAPVVATRQRRLQQRQQLTTACGGSSSSTSPTLVGNRERPAKRRSCLLAMDRVRETSTCRKHKVAKGTSGSAAAASAEANSSPASKLRRLVKHKQPRCACCCASPAAAVGRSGRRTAATSRLASAKKRQCSKQRASRTAAAAAAARRRHCSM